MNGRTLWPALAALFGGLVVLLAWTGTAFGAEVPTEAIETDGYAGALGNSKVAALMFWGLSALTIGGALFVITRRNMISAVMGMVGTFFCIAALYAMLYAHFLAVIQILVYAGAIMVLFVFVVMILNRAEEQPWATRGLASKGIAGLALLYLFVRLVQVLWTVKDSAAAELASPVLSGVSVPIGTVAEFGSTQAIGRVLFNQYLFPFEAVSIVLLIAVVGAVAVARPSVMAHGQADEGEE